MYHDPYKQRTNTGALLEWLAAHDRPGKGVFVPTVKPVVKMPLFMRDALQSRRGKA